MTDTEPQMRKLLSAVATMTDQMSGMSREIAGLKQEVAEMKEIVAAWEAVKTGGKFVKWLAGVASGIAGMWLIAKAVGASMLK